MKVSGRRVVGELKAGKRINQAPAPPRHRKEDMSQTDYEAQEEQTMIQTVEALRNPQVGDRFHEMLSFWMFVLEVTPETVTFMTAAPPCTFPDDGKIETLPREGFLKKFTYESIPDNSYLLLADRGNNVAGWLKEK
jgi:hypothetical protein